eukprot:TRINITY_DN175_c0_g3_i2.p1 TRINITY_DN175_c0_g3~~TRINITY_DN175_c0_g3_i2.p1  ORF type:complete len:344 (+),score=71.16 TRINITY_DN175_c0_g3_i2:308-1339(+)
MKERNVLSAAAADALKRFEFENNIQTVEPDQIYHYDANKQQAEVAQKRWTNEPNYFKKVKISAIALVKMVMHARSGGDLEVMGLTQGKIDGDTFIIVDAFALPVEASETRVNATTEAYEFIFSYISTLNRVGRNENTVGWYHSHPGYGCWLSGIDVTVQTQYQDHNDPWVAIVVDPKRTISSGKVDIGAFRVYPKGYKSPDEIPSEYQSIPLSKIEDFGVHCKAYYPLEVSCIKSTLDTHLLYLLWTKYWVNTISSSPLLTNREYITNQITDLADKLEQAEAQLAQAERAGPLHLIPEKKKDEESQLSKLTKDCSKTAIEQVNGLVTQVTKGLLFFNVRAGSE